MRTMRRAILAVVIVTLASVIGPFGAVHAMAKISSCRTDPIVKLSNGKQVNLTASFSDDMTHVTKITYSVNVPAGLSVTSVVLTAASPVREAVVLSYTNAANTYTTATTVSSTSTSVAVSASTALKYTSTGKTIVSASASGVENKVITLQVVG